MVAVPTMDAGRVCTVRTTDLWGFVVDEAAGNDVGRVLVASPGWTGGVPTGVDRVAGAESPFVQTEIGVRTLEPCELCDVKNIQHDLVLAPLSELGGVAAPVAAPPVEWWPVHRGVSSSNGFWSVANFALSLTTPNEQDRSMYERIAEIGVGAGRRWEASRFDDRVLEAIGEGIDDAITELMRASATVADDREFHRSRADTDRDYFGRAIGALQRGSAVLADSG